LSQSSDSSNLFDIVAADPAPLRDVSPPVDREVILERIAAIRAEMQRRTYFRDGVAWVQDVLGDTIWTKQREIITALQTHRKVSVTSCHGVGKSFIAAAIVAWWLARDKVGDAFVVTSAPTGHQVKAILWREIARAHDRGGLKGRLNQDHWLMPVTTKDGETREELVAFGKKPDDYKPTNFQGIHAPRVLVVFDEACGIAPPLWEAAESLISNEQSKFLAIGNPDDPTTQFAEISKPNSGWHVIDISAFSSPNFTGEAMPQRALDQLIGYTYVEERRAKWAPRWTWTADRTAVIPPPDSKPEDTHPFWQSKVLGKFPVQSITGSLISLSWIRAAQVRELAPVGENELGLDVGASKDGDPSCLGHRRGPVFRVIWEQREPDTMATTGRLIQSLRDRTLGAVRAKVDYIGVGRGVVDRAREQDLPVHPIQVGEASTVLSCVRCKTEWDAFGVDDPRCPKCSADGAKPIFANLLAQLWWDVRTMFEQGTIDIDPNDEDLAAELLTLTWRPNSKGQTVVEYGNGPSPNRADALMLTFAPVRERPVQELVW